MGYGWGGHANGKIPYSELIFVRGAWLEPSAAYWAEAMSIVFFSIFGKHLDYSEGFRDYDRQVYLYDGWIRKLAGFFAASYPGGSIHGWALAVDVDLTGMTDEEIDWLHTVGRQFGWNWETTGRPNNERWHLDFNLTPTFPFDPANYNQKEEDTLSAAEVQQIISAITTHIEASTAVRLEQLMKGGNQVAVIECVETTEFKGKPEIGQIVGAAAGFWEVLPAGQQKGYANLLNDTGIGAGRISRVPWNVFVWLRSYLLPGADVSESVKLDNLQTALTAVAKLNEPVKPASA